MSDLRPGGEGRAPETRPGGPRLVLYGLAIVALVAAVVYPLRRYVIEPNRETLLGHVETPARELAQASRFGFETAAGDAVRVVPGSPTMELGDMPSEAVMTILGGFRGPYVVWLWIKAEEEKDQKIHFNLIQRYTQIAILQSDYAQVWTYHAWNLAFNESVQWQSPERKYQWIRRAIEFLEEGQRRNPHSADIMGAIGWTYDLKLGRSQEAEYYRKRVLEEEGQSVFLLAYAWYDRARQANDRYHTLLHAGLSKPAFYEQACHCVTFYAMELSQQSYDTFKASLDARAAGREEESRRQFDIGRRQAAEAVGAWQWAAREWKDHFTRFEAEGISAMLDEVSHRFYDETSASADKMESFRRELTYENLPEKFKELRRPEIH